MSQIIYEETLKDMPKKVLVTTTAIPESPISFEQWIKRYNVGRNYDRRIVHIDNIPKLKK